MKYLYLLLLLHLEKCFLLIFVLMGVVQFGLLWVQSSHSMTQYEMFSRQ